MFTLISFHFQGVLINVCSKVTFIVVNVEAKSQNISTWKNSHLHYFVAKPYDLVLEILSWTLMYWKQFQVLFCWEIYQSNFGPPLTVKPTKIIVHKKCIKYMLKFMQVFISISHKNILEKKSLNPTAMVMTMSELFANEKMSALLMLCYCFFI